MRLPPSPLRASRVSLLRNFASARLDEFFLYRFALPDAAPARSLSLVAARPDRPGGHGRGAADRGRAGCGAGAGAQLAATARHLGIAELSTPVAAAGVFGGQRAAGRVWRGAPGVHAHWTDSRSDEKSGAGHRRRPLLSARRHRLARGGSRAAGESGALAQSGRLDHHHAGGTQFLSVARQDLHPQVVRGAAGAEDRAADEQGPDSAALHESDFPRPQGLRFCRGRTGLLRQTARPALPGADGDAGRSAQSALGLQPHQQPAAGAAAPVACDRALAATALDHPDAGATGPGRTAGAAHRADGGQRACGLHHGDGASDGVRPLPRSRLHARIECLHDHTLARSTGGLALGAERRTVL